MTTTIAPAFDLIRQGIHHDPHSFLGMHPGPGGLVARVYDPAAKSVVLRETGGTLELPLAEAGEGLFEAAIPGHAAPFAYTLDLKVGRKRWTRGDPYRFTPTLGELDLHFFGEGTHRRLWERLGAHVRTIDGETGVAFAVWAPSARGVSLAGGFNGWNRVSHPMRVLGSSGVWELFLPGLARGECYKFIVRGADGIEREKADPFALSAEVRPRTGSVVWGESDYSWADGSWMAARATKHPYQEPMSVYEVHLGSWRRNADGTWLGYRQCAEQLAEYSREMGFTHVELLPVAEHPFDGSWGYQVSGFFAPTSRYGSPDDFRAFVDTLHQAGIGVIIDWVPAHFVADAHGLGQFDGTFLYEHADPRKRFQPDWGTLSFNYGRNEVRNFLLANALFWLREFHIDGLRVDAVSSMLYLDYSRKAGEWLPNRFGGREHLEAIDFLKAFNELVYGEGDGAITVAEESTAWPGVSRPTYANGLGFGFKWNMGWMHDTLEYFKKDPIHRRHHQNTLTFSMVYAFSENFWLSLSHDEVVHGKGSLLHKMPGDEWQQFANLRLLFAYQHAMPGKKLIFMGDEFGQRGEWDHDRAVEWEALSYGPHAGVRNLLAALNHLHAAEPALHALDHDPGGFEWLDFGDHQNSIISFLRRSPNAVGDLVCAFNFTPVPRYDYLVPVPTPGAYEEVLNTDASEWGGSGIGNLGAAVARQGDYLGRPASMAITLPPLAAVVFKRRGRP